MKNLVIVESPTKVKKIEEFLGEDYVVKSSNGHIRDLAKKEMSIDIENQYEPEYQITEEKHKLVAELKRAVKDADVVWLASDEDREGEAIAWHLQETLKLDPEKTRRIVFNEITKNAILQAIEHPRSVDMNLVDAQQARRVLDRLVGYEISPILWAKIKPALSAGRVQSVAVRLVVEREEEVKNFESRQYFRLTAQLHPVSGRSQVVAELSRRFDTEQEATAFVESLVGCSYKVQTIDTKPARRSPAPPFTTSTLQQEASRKLGYSVARTMQIAQQLYENGFITYMRTDSVNLSELALNMAKSEITKLYGENYVNIRRYHTKTKGAQEAHEAIRPTYMENVTINADAAQRRLYELIWKRAIASQMADAEIEKTSIDISISGHEETLVCQGEQVRFDGFLKVYMESTDDEPMENVGATRTLPKVVEGMLLNLDVAEATEHFTQHPPRYTEASLIKKLEELGIGRPSTYAPTISTILKREYVIKEDREPKEVECTAIVLKDDTVHTEKRTKKMGEEKGKLFPTDIGTVVNAFLMEHFADIVDYNFTAMVEKDFDDIATGKKQWRKVVDKFYVPFHKNIRLTQQTSHRTSGSRLIGVDPKSGRNVYAKIGRYGTLVQLGDTSNEEKPKFASMKKGQSIETITLEEALALFNLPRTVGEFEGHDVIVSIGKYGPYVRLDNKFYSLSKYDDPYEVDLDRCIEIIKNKRIAEAEKERLRELYPHEIGEHEGQTISTNIGRYGPYLSYRGENFRLPKQVDPLKLTVEEALAIVNNAEEKKPRGRKKKSEK
ncbi:MAG: type I DNA topoisomerase [Bacteroidales bacterium]|nr:type I DNA topoisomerase [Bacteroidales bacterium]